MQYNNDNERDVHTDYGYDSSKPADSGRVTEAHMPIDAVHTPVEKSASERFDTPVYDDAHRAQRFNTPAHNDAHRVQQFDMPTHDNAPQVQRFDTPAHYSAPQERRLDTPKHYGPPQAQRFGTPAHSVPQAQRFEAPAHDDAPQAQRFEAPTHDDAPQAQRYDTPVHDGAPQAQRFNTPARDDAPKAQQMSGFRGYEQHGDHVNTPHGEDWREPSYSQTSETVSHMYSPGICVNQPYSRKRIPEAEPERTKRDRSGMLGRFVRAVCLVMICAAISGASAYLLMDYRISRGDFDTVKQVVLGGVSTPRDESGTMTAPVSIPGSGMAAEDIYEMALNHVVGIKTEIVHMSGMFSSLDTITAVAGSGFIISTDGYILTNYHVIESAHLSDLPLNVYLHDGTSYEAEIIGFEASNDFAVIKIDASGLSPAIIGNSDNIRVGQSVYAIGNPFGDLVYTMTEGIVSALDRVVTVDRKSIETFQFSAAVNSGNSGGPIYNANGEVIGIVTAKLIRSSVEGIGFAIPINDAISIASELIEHGYISGRPLLGIMAQTVTSGYAEYFGWVEGVYVSSIIPDSAADKAGLKVNDIIIAIGDAEIDSRESLAFAMRKHKAGDTVPITIWRNGEELALSITFDEDLSAGQPQRTQPAETPTP